MVYYSVDNNGIVLKHHGVKGMKKGVRRWQNEDGTLTEEGYVHYYGERKPRESKKADLNTMVSNTKTYDGFRNLMNTIQKDYNSKNYTDKDLYYRFSKNSNDQDVKEMKEDAILALKTLRESKNIKDDYMNPYNKDWQEWVLYDDQAFGIARVASFLRNGMTPDNVKALIENAKSVYDRRYDEQQNDDFTNSVLFDLSEGTTPVDDIYETLKKQKKEVKHSDEDSSYLMHHGVKGQRHGVRRWQNEDGTLTPAGYAHYGINPDGTAKQKTADEKYKDRLKEAKQNVAIDRVYQKNDLKMQRAYNKEELRAKNAERRAFRHNIFKYAIGATALAGTAYAGYSFIHNRNLDKVHYRKMDEMALEGRNAINLEKAKNRTEYLQAKNQVKLAKVNKDVNIAKETAKANANRDIEIAKQRTIMETNAEYNRRLANKDYNKTLQDHDKMLLETNKDYNDRLSKVSANEAKVNLKKSDNSRKIEVAKITQDAKTKRNENNTKFMSNINESIQKSRSERLDKKNASDLEKAKVKKLVSEYKAKQKTERVSLKESNLTKRVEAQEAGKVHLQEVMEKGLTDRKVSDNTTELEKAKINKLIEQYKIKHEKPLPNEIIVKPKTTSSPKTSAPKAPKTDKYYGIQNKIVDEAGKVIRKIFKHSDIEIEHSGIKGQQWGVRRFRNEDGTLTPEGRIRYGLDKNIGSMTNEQLQRAISRKKLENEYLGIYTEGVKKKSKSISEVVGATGSTLKGAGSLGKASSAAIKDEETKAAVEEVSKSATDTGTFLGNKSVQEGAGALATRKELLKKSKEAFRNTNEMSDEELSNMLSRMKLEREYTNLVNPPKPSNWDRTREFLQTMGTFLAIATPIVTIIAGNKKKEGK